MTREVPVLAGVDGCRAGWIAAVRLPGEAPALRLVARLADLVAALPDDAMIAVDMPIGLPERIVGPGRAAEQAARRRLRARRPSLFSVPARAAVEAAAGPFADARERDEARRRACAIARRGSDPPKAFSIQAFGIFPKIIEIDALLRGRPLLATRIVESHPELAFAILNGGNEMTAYKKTRAGSRERRALLLDHGLDANCLDAALPRGAGRDDWLDACVLLLVAGRLARREAIAFPDPPDRDAHGLPVAIWA